MLFGKGWRKESFRVSRLGARIKTASQRQMEVDPSVEQKPLQGEDLTLGVEDSAVGLQDHQHIPLPKAITKLGLFPNHSVLRNRCFQLLQPISQQAFNRQRRLHLAEGLQDGAGIGLQSLQGTALRDFDLTPASPSFEKRLNQVAQQAPDGVFPFTRFSSDSVAIPPVVVRLSRG